MVWQTRRTLSRPNFQTFENKSETGTASPLLRGGKTLHACPYFLDDCLKKPPLLFLGRHDENIFGMSFQNFFIFVFPCFLSQFHIVASVFWPEHFPCLCHLLCIHCVEASKGEKPYKHATPKVVSAMFVILDLFKHNHHCKCFSVTKHRDKLLSLTAELHIQISPFPPVYRLLSDGWPAIAVPTTKISTPLLPLSHDPPVHLPTLPH